MNYYLTGDLGYLNKGYLFIRQKKNLIIKLVNIYPKDIQCVILRNKNIKNCIVLGVKDSFWRSANSNM